MSNNKFSKRLSVIFINLSGIIILFFFQYMMFAFLPAVKPNSDKIIFRNNTYSFIFKKDIIVILEALVGVSILFFLNVKVLKYPKRNSLLIAVFEFLILLCVTLYFSIDYINNK
jgi:hypothetical protein